MGARVKSTRVPSWVPFFNFIAKPLLAAGVPMGPDVLLTIRGRKTGLPRTTPVTIAENSGRRGLIAPSAGVTGGAIFRLPAGEPTAVGRRKRRLRASGWGQPEQPPSFATAPGLTARQPGRA